MTDRKIFSKPETARMLGISVSTLNRMTEAGTGPRSVIIGKRMHFIDPLAWVEHGAR